jgi:hypothetical protein
MKIQRAFIVLILATAFLLIAVSPGLAEYPRLSNDRGIAKAGESTDTPTLSSSQAPTGEVILGDLPTDTPTPTDTPLPTDTPVPQLEYTLTVISGNGTVSKSPNQATYHYGDVVQLTANANAGWTFAYWSGGMSGSSNPVSLTIQGSTVVAANYIQNDYILTVSY